tara:strand:+ start:25394 stop:26590 length:1197 start_codon:yes stop_codon:yes gene_type:complete
MDQFTFTDKSKKIFIGLMLIGVLSIIYGVIDGDISGHRIWTSALINGWFFFSTALMGTVFIAINSASQSGWIVVLKRVFEAVSMYVPVGALTLILVFFASTMHWNHIYHWMTEGITDPNSPHYDAIIAHKEPYLNLPFWWGRALVMLAVWTYFTLKYRKKSILEDTEGGTKIYTASMVTSALFLVFFAYSSVVASWDWLMSIDAHWFSTLYGWYIFSGMWISGMVMVFLLTHYLMGKGYLKQVNASHIHDLGKFIFGISFLWTYLFFSQFMLIWYANIPEEVTYYIPRINDYSYTFWGMVIVNFIIPMLFLMSKTTKRNRNILAVVSVIIFFGHWVDIYFLITPGAMKADGTIGIVELGMLLGYLGLFLFVVFRELAKAPLVVKNHPLLNESEHHHIN